MKKVYTILMLLLMMVSACEFRLKPTEGSDAEQPVEVQRYDRLESIYLTTGDFSALQQMETGYPMETRALIENVLKLGVVNDPEIHNKLLAFFQDTTLQVVISDAEAQYARMEDVNRQLQQAFGRLTELVPGFPIPRIYAQIGALDQSIVVGDGSVGISLDKYLGADYPLYKRFYNEQQRQTMTRSHIVPDCLCFYLLSIYPLNDFELRSQQERDLHMGKLMWVSNHVMQHRFFTTKNVDAIGRYMKRHPSVTVEQLLKMTDYAPMQ